MKLCPMCGAQNGDTSNFCTTCGAKLSAPEPEQPIFQAPEAPAFQEPEAPVFQEPEGETPEPPQENIYQSRETEQVKSDPWQAFAPAEPEQTEPEPSEPEPPDPEPSDPWQAFAPAESRGGVAVAEAESAPEEPVHKRSCAVCGAPLPEGSKFCINCGTAVAPPPAPEPEPAAGVVCPSCGAVLAEGAKFCIQCGAKITVPEPEPVREVVCPSCGTVLAPEAKFCIQCGAKISPVSSPAPEPEKAKQAVCPVCGAPLAEGAKFCTSCGANLSATPEPGPEPEKKRKKEKSAKKKAPKKGGGVARTILLALALVCLGGMLAVCFLWDGMEIFSMRAWDNYDEAALLSQSYGRSELIAAREKLTDEEWEDLSAYLAGHTQQEAQELFRACGLEYFSSYDQAKAVLDLLEDIGEEGWDQAYTQWQSDVAHWQEQNQQYTAVIGSELGRRCQSFLNAGGADYYRLWEYLYLWRQSLKTANLRFGGFSSEFIQLYSSYISQLKVRGADVDAAGSSLVEDYQGYIDLLAQTDEERLNEFWGFRANNSIEEQRFFLEDYFPDVPSDNREMFLIVVNTVASMPATSERQSQTTPTLKMNEDGTVRQYSQYSSSYDRLMRRSGEGWYSWWTLTGDQLPKTMSFFDHVDANTQLISLYDVLLRCGMSERELEDLLELITLYFDATDDEITALTQVLGSDLDGEKQPPAFPIETPFPEETRLEIIESIVRLEEGQIRHVLLPLYRAGVQALPQLCQLQSLDARLADLAERAPYAAEAYYGLTDGSLSATMFQVRQYGAYLFWGLAGLMLLLVLIFTLARRGKAVGAFAAMLGGGLGAAYAWISPALPEADGRLCLVIYGLGGALVLLGLLALILRPRRG